MVSICFYFQVHQPRRLREYSVFDIRNNQDYFDDKKNEEVVKKVANKCYLPMNKLLLGLIKQHQGKFKISFSISGVCLEQFEQYAPEVLQSFKDLAATGCVEFLSETYYHSLSFIHDEEEFKEQVRLQNKKVRELFGQEPVVFRNTELIYTNALAPLVEEMGFSAVLAEGWDYVLGWRNPNFNYSPYLSDGRQPNVALLLKNYKLSDDIAFRFGNKGWNEYPLTVDKFERWVSANNGCGDVVNLFMDYETFGEHQWEDTGIFEFMKQLPGAILRHPDNNFVTVSESAKRFQKRDKVDVPHLMSWADMERDVSAWLGNKMQETAAQELYKILPAVKKHAAETGDDSLLTLWRYLSTSDHFYYMCTKWFNDGDVHKYFSPYESPYEGYIAFMNVLNDMAYRAGIQTQKQQTLTEQPSTVIVPKATNTVTHTVAAESAVAEPALMETGTSPNLPK